MARLTPRNVRLKANIEPAVRAHLTQTGLSFSELVNTALRRYLADEGALKEAALITELEAIIARYRFSVVSHGDEPDEQPGVTGQPPGFLVLPHQSSDERIPEERVRAPLRAWPGIHGPDRPASE